MDENTVVPSASVAPETGTFITEQAAQAEPQEAPAVEPPKPEVMPDKFASKFAALTRKEKELRQREQAIVAKLAEAEKRAKELEERASKEKSLEDMIKENPLRALREKYGYDFDKLAEMQLNDENPTADMKLDRRAKELEEKTLSRIEQLEKQIAEKEEQAKKAQYEAITKQFKQEISKEISSNPEVYELILANEAENEVFDLIETYYNQTAEYQDGVMVKEGIILTVQDAAKHVEDHYEEEAKRILKLKKFNKQTSPEEQEKKVAAPTLSNDLASESPKNGSKFMSDEESKREAAKLIRFNS